MFDQQDLIAFSYWMTVIVVDVGWLVVCGGSFVGG
jgi:hypothetical protein